MSKIPLDKVVAEARKLEKKRQEESDRRKFVLYCKTLGLPEPKPEYQFHPTRKWRIDYFFEHNGYQVALEVEGGTWGTPVKCNHCNQMVKTKNGKAVMQSTSRHTSGAGFQGDIEKYNTLSLMGIYILRVQPKNLMKLDTLKMIKHILEI